MATESSNNRLSRISTIWSVLDDARSDSGARHAAQQLLVECYGPAVRSYLLKLTGNADLTDDLWQGFMLKLLDGAFAKASPEHGRFRNYVKTTLFHMVATEFRQKVRRPNELQHEPTDSQSTEFDDHWRQNLIDRTWELLEDAQPRYARMLRLRTEYPDHSVERLVELSPGVESDAALRKLLSRSRQRFAMLLVDEVARSIKAPSKTHIEEELGSLNLLERCRPALDSWSGSSEP